jgi:hypothetical protein
MLVPLSIDLFNQTDFMLATNSAVASQYLSLGLTTSLGGGTRGGGSSATRSAVASKFFCA